MKKIVVINSGNHGSVGNVIYGIADMAKEYEMETFVFCPPGRMQKNNMMNNEFIGSVFERRISDVLNSITAQQGSRNFFATHKLINRIKEIEPDIIHLHNLHSNYINLELLFEFLKRCNIPIVWTLHDSWTYTGHCTYYDDLSCDGWEYGCAKCKNYKEYPKELFDNASVQLEKKKRIFSGISNLHIVTPSNWLAGEVKKSFLNQYPVTVINNGVDQSTFYFRKEKSEYYNIIKNKFVILGVAFGWSFTKGLDRFEKLAERLDARYKIVLVGISSASVKTDKILCIERTDNQEQLAMLYSEADVLLNPTRADNFPTVNIEALSCGLPILSYGAGGSAEAFDDTTGKIVDDNNILEVLDKLYEKNFSRNACLERAKLFRKEDRYSDYVNLYREIL